MWANQSRRCPLCSADMAPFLLHELDDTVPTKVREALDEVLTSSSTSHPCLNGSSRPCHSPAHLDASTCLMTDGESGRRSSPTSWMCK